MKKIAHTVFIFSLALTSVGYAEKFNTSVIHDNLGIHKASQRAVDRHVISLNTATVNQLRRLKGIGSKLAQNVIEYRKEKGQFKRMDDLQRVNGFSKKLIERLIENNPSYKIQI